MGKEIDVIDIAKINKKVKEISDEITKREQERAKIVKEIEELKTKKDRFDRETATKVKADFKKFENEMNFIKTIREKLYQLSNAYKRVMKTQEDMLEFYRKGFRRLTTQRVVIPQEVFNFKDSYYGDSYYLTLYSRGFGKCYNYDGQSQYIEDWETLKKIFEHPSIVEYIAKQDKQDIFNAFSDAVCNWLDIERDETDNIQIEKNVPYLEIKEEYYNNKISIRHTQTNQITIAKDYWGKMQIEIGYARKNIDTLGFGELYAIAHVWKELHEQIDEKISRYNCIAENNELVLEQLRKEISSHIVVDEL